MRPLKVKAKVIEEYNDSKNNDKLVEEGTVIELDYGRFEQLRALGKVEEYKEDTKPLKQEYENNDTFEAR